MARNYVIRLSLEGAAEIVNQLKATGTAGDKMVADLVAKVPALGPLFDQVGKRADATKKKIEDLARADFAKLQASYDPVIAKQQQFAKGVDTIKRATDAGVISTAQASRATGLLSDSIFKADRSNRVFAQGLDVTKNALGALGLAIGIGEMVSFGREVFVSTAQLVDQADQARVTVEQLQAYRLILKESGGQAADADGFIQRLTVALGKAQEQGSTADTVFGRLGLRFEDITGIPIPQMFQRVAQAILDEKDATKQAADIQEVFGKGSASIITALPRLAQNIDAVADSYAQLGKIVSEGTARQAKRELDELSSSWEQLKVSAAAPVTFVVQVITDGLDKLSELRYQIAYFRQTSLFGQDAETVRGLKQEIADVQADISKTQGLFPKSVIDQDRAHLAELQAKLDKLLHPHFINDQIATTTAGKVLPYISVGGPAAELEQQRVRADLAHQTTLEQAEYNNLKSLALAQLAQENEGVKGQKKTLADIGLDRAAIVGYLGKERAALAITNADSEIAGQLASKSSQEAQRRAEQLQRYAGAFNDYLGKLDDESGLIGQGNFERTRVQDLIAGANALLKEQQGAHARTVVSLSEAVTVLGEKKTAEIEVRDIVKDEARFEADILQPLRDQVSVLGVSSDLRERALRLVQLEHEFSGKTLANKKAEYQLDQQILDSQHIDDDIAKMREEVSLAGLEADEQERISAVLQEIHQNGGTISADQRTQIENLIRLRQETEHWKGVLDDVGNVIHDDLTKLATGEGFNLKQLGHDLGEEFASELTAPIAKALKESIAKPVVDQLKGIVDELTAALGLNTDSGAADALVDETLKRNALALAIQTGTTAMDADTASVERNTAARNANTDSIAGGSGLDSFAPGIVGLQSSVSLGKGGSVAGASLPSWLQGALKDIGGFQIGAPGGLISGSLGGALGGAFSGAGYGSLVGSLLHLPNQGGAATGGAIGGAIGSIIPGVGNIIGSIAGSLIGGLIRESDKALATFGANGSVSLSGKASSNPLASQAATAIQGTLAALKAAGVEFTDSVHQIAIGQKDLSGFELSSQSHYTRINSRGDPAALAKAVVDELLKTAKIDDPNLKQVLTGNTFDSIDSLNQAVGFVHDVYDVIVSGKPQLNAVEQAMRDLEDAADAAASKAQELGLSVEALAAGEKASFDKSIAQQILGITDPLQAALAEEQKNADARLEAARKFGADIAQVEQLNALERQQVIEQFAKQTTDGLKNLIDDITFGGLSAADPKARFDAALASFRSTEANANATHSADDIAAFEKAARDLLPLARDFLGTTTDYAALAAEVVRDAQNLGGSAPSAQVAAILGQSSDPVLPPSAAQIAAGGGTTQTIGGNADLLAILQQVSGKLDTIQATLVRGFTALDVDITDLRADVSGRLTNLTTEQQRANANAAVLLRRSQIKLV